MFYWAPINSNAFYDALPSRPFSRTYSWSRIFLLEICIWNKKNDLILLCSHLHWAFTWMCFSLFHYTTYLNKFMFHGVSLGKWTLEKKLRFPWTWWIFTGLNGVFRRVTLQCSRASRPLRCCNWIEGSFAVFHHVSSACWSGSTDFLPGSTEFSGV